MGNEKLISVIIPVYGVEKYIHQCLDSIITQSYKNLEIIVINDGTRDRSAEIAKEYARKDSRIRVYDYENAGVSVARNRGLDLAKGDYISFVDSDDWLNSDFYKKLALSIAKNMSREAVQLVKVYVNIQGSSPNGGEVEVTPNMAESDIKVGTGSTANAVILKEVEQDWILGVKQQKPVLFTVNPTYVNAGTASAPNEVVWGDVTYNTGKKTVGGADPSTTITSDGVPAAAGSVVNSKLMADYEYFYMGERGDQYRMVDFPNYIPTTYLVDPTNAYGYDTVAIHFAYVGANHSVQKSEKDITILVPRASTDNDSADELLAVGAKTASLVAAINAAVQPAADSRYIAAGEALTSGYIPVFDTNGALTASAKKPSDIS